MIELDDCGGKRRLRVDYPWQSYADVFPIMVIKALRGTMALFDQHYISPDTQCEAIRAFMKEHVERE